MLYGLTWGTVLVNGNGMAEEEGSLPDGFDADLRIGHLHPVLNQLRDPGEVHQEEAHDECSRSKESPFPYPRWLGHRWSIALVRNMK